MKRQILDCTLRDGGYVVNKNFDTNVMAGIIHELNDSGVDFVEIGFLQDDISKGESTVFRNAQMASKWLPKKRKAMYTVLADYSRYSVDNLEPFSGNSFDAVRVCFFKHERNDVIDFCRSIKEKGYILFIQPVDALGYSHLELLHLIESVNALEPDCFSIVDTFGSMYLDDLRTIFDVVNHNLDRNIKMGFHSHNNLQMSNALAQEFANLAQNKRDVVIDTTLYGMGRGAGNTPTELVAQYLNSHMAGSYNIDKILDVIDSYILNIKYHYSWGYDIPMFISGCYSAHVNNVNYLEEKPTLRFQDLRILLSQLSADDRKRYDYNHLERLFLDYMNTKSIAEDNISHLDMLINKDILIVAPGKSQISQHESINRYIEQVKPVIVAVNHIPLSIKVDYLFFSNQQRFNYWKYDGCFDRYKVILTSNISSTVENVTVDLGMLLKSGWNNLDNAIILLMRLLNRLAVKSIALAGFDGYFASGNNYVVQGMEREICNYDRANMEISQMLADFVKSTSIKPIFVTPSRFEEVIDGSL